MRITSTFMLIAASAVAGCGSVVFNPLPQPEPVPAEVALERREDRDQAATDRLRRCQMGETGVKRDDRLCRDGVPR